MKNTRMTNKQKWLASLILFGIGIAAILVALIFFILGCVKMNVKGPSDYMDSSGNIISMGEEGIRLMPWTGIILLAFLIGYFILLGSALFNYSYRKNNEAPGKVSTVTYIIACVIDIAVMAFVLIHAMSPREYADDEEKRTHKRFITSAIMFVVSLIGFAIGVVLLVLGSVTDIMALTIVGGPVFCSGSFFVFWISGIFNLLYRKDCRENNEKPRVLSTAMLIVDIVIAVITIIILLIVLIYVFVFGRALGGKQEDIITVDKDGKEETLTSTHDDMFNQHYQDKDGGEWVSKDGGQTVEKLVKEATVMDEDGNKFNLTAPFAGSSTFTDQNGDKWWTSDGGETFKRL